MATAPAHRGRGYGLALLQAAEQLVAEVGESQIYLHLRLAPPALPRSYVPCSAHDCSLPPLLWQDGGGTSPRDRGPPVRSPLSLAFNRVQDAAAARLYQKAGYQQVAADSFLVRLLGLDQRRLMRKVL